MSMSKEDIENEEMFRGMLETVDDMFMRMFGRAVCEAELSAEELAKLDELEGDDDEDEADEE